MTLDEAVEIVARKLLTDSLGWRDWEDYPELGEYDWNRVMQRAKLIAAASSHETFVEAYALLASRADGDV